VVVPVISLKIEIRHLKQAVKAVSTAEVTSKMIRSVHLKQEERAGKKAMEAVVKLVTPD
jgi:hypothetical protein